MLLRYKKGRVDGWELGWLGYGEPKLKILIQAPVLLGHKNCPSVIRPWANTATNTLGKKTGTVKAGVGAFFMSYKTD